MSDSDKNSIKLEEEDGQQIQDEPENYLSYHRLSQDEVDPNENNEIQSGLDLGNNGALDIEPQLSKKRTHRKLEISNFIMKTFKILEDKRNSIIVQWTDQGNCFIVKDKEKFSREILPKYFKHSKFSSFVRQLNMYDFHKIRKEKQIPIFKHKYFKMGAIDQLHKIKRKSGEDCKQQDLISKEHINMSDQVICSLPGIQNLSSKQSILLKNNKEQNSQLTPHGEIQFIKRQNNELKQSIGELTQQINYLEFNREKRKEKLVKMITSLVFFDLNNDESIHRDQISLRSLQEHLVSEEEPMSFSDYRDKLSTIYCVLKRSLI